ncbi:MAG: glycosyltransferase family 4 protein [Gemmataceae bacterium]|nr:glycosyltransferase family 4 protein [Gemmataceae bacterium]
MKIAFLDSWLQSSAQGSGTAVAIGGLRQALEARGHEVTRLAPDATWPANLILRRLRFNLKLPALLRQRHFDLIVGFDIDGFLWSGRGRRSPYVVSVKGVLAEEARQETGRWRWLLGALARLERRNVRRAPLVLTTSDYCRRALVRHYGVPARRVRLVPEGIDLARWQRLVREVPPTGDGATVLCVARQYRRKHVADLLRAMPLVRRVVPHARALVVGDGPEHANLRRLWAELQLGETVRLLGEIPDDEAVARLYRQADVFCLPSVQEGFGIVFLEAMASGLPVVATTAAAIPEVVPQGNAGILVRPGDVEGLAAALAELLRAPRQRAACAAFGREHVRQFDWPVVAGRFLDECGSASRGD